MQTAKVNLTKQVDSINTVMDIRQVNGYGDFLHKLNRSFPLASDYL